MQILILGGTGAMGIELVKLLVEQGHQVTVSSRSKRTSTEHIQYVKGNALDPQFLQELLSRHWDAIVDFMTYSTAAFVPRKESLLAATSHYIFLSSARVYADSATPIKEDSPRLLDASEDTQFLKTDAYALTKARQEDLLTSSTYKNWTIIRPYITYNDYRLQLGVLEKEAWLHRALAGRSIVFSKTMADKLTTMTYGYDVARALALIIDRQIGKADTFHITNNKPVKWSYILGIYLDVLEKHLGKRPKVLLQNDEKFLEVFPEAYQIIYDRHYNRVFDNTKISQLIDLESFTDYERGLRQSLNNFIANPQYKIIPWILEAKKDRQCREMASLLSFPGIRRKLGYIYHRFFMK